MPSLQLPQQQLVSRLLIAAVFWFLSASATVHGGELVTGRYVRASGKNIVLALSIGNPAPANLIVEQNIPPGNAIVGSSPPAKKVDNRQGTVKWLFRNTTSGNLHLSIELASPVKGGVNSMVRYRNPQTGAFTELRIVP